MLCLRKAFSPSTRIAELNVTENTLNKYLCYLRRKYDARNTRHLMFLRYARNAVKHERLKATKRGLQILAGFARGETYEEIAAGLGISDRCIEKHLDKLKNDNFLQDSDELIVLYADWEITEKSKKAINNNG